MTVMRGLLCCLRIDRGICFAHQAEYAGGFHVCVACDVHPLGLEHELDQIVVDAGDDHPVILFFSDAGLSGRLADDVMDRCEVVSHLFFLL